MSSEKISPASSSVGPCTECCLEIIRSKGTAGASPMRMEYSFARRLYSDILATPGMDEDAVEIIAAARKIVCSSPVSHGVSTRRVLGCLVEIDADKNRIQLAAKAVVRCLIASDGFDDMFEVRRKRNALFCAC